MPIDHRLSLYPAFCMIVLLIVMLLMMVTLHNRTTGRRYVYLAMGFVAAVLPVVGLTILTLSDIGQTPIRTFFSCMMVTSGNLVQLLVFNLYRPKKTKLLGWYMGATGSAFLLSCCSFILGTTTAVTASDMLSIGWVCFCFARPELRLESKGKYTVSLVMMGAVSLLGLIHAFFADTMISFTSWLLTCIFYFLQFVLVFERIVETIQAVNYKSITDGLTSLFNRKYLDTKVKQALQSGKPISVIFSDIDNFKRLNDTKGHDKGDEMLIAVARIMKEVCEDVGIVGRYGGEEMVVLLTQPGTYPAVIAESIRTRVEAETIVTVSVGFSASREGITAQELIKQADDAMYRAKTTGKNKCIAYEEDPWMTTQTSLG